MLDVLFEGDAREVSGPWTGRGVRFRQGSIPELARDQTPTQSMRPPPTLAPAAAVVGVLEGPYLTAILIAAFALALVIVIVAVAGAIYSKLSKNVNTIYAGEADARDENEMGMVEVKSRCKLTDAYGPVDA